MRTGSEETELKIKISVDCVTYGNNKSVSSTNVIKTVSELLDDRVREIIIRKEPIPEVSAEKAKDFSLNNHLHK